MPWRLGNGVVAIGFFVDNAGLAGVFPRSKVAKFSAVLHSLAPPMLMSEAVAAGQCHKVLWLSDGCLHLALHLLAAVACAQSLMHVLPQTPEEIASRFQRLRTQSEALAEDLVARPLQIQEGSLVKEEAKVLWPCVVAVVTAVAVSWGVAQTAGIELPFHLALGAFLGFALVPPVLVLARGAAIVDGAALVALFEATSNGLELLFYQSVVELWVAQPWG